jgi:CheY-like chemotaxis protein
MATVLTMGGFTVHTAAGGVAALEILDSGQCVPGLVLMDAQMPGLSGTELIEKLRNHTHVCVYIVSGSNPPDDVVAASDGYLLKPLGLDALHKLLDEHATQPRRELRRTLSNPPASGADEPVVHAETLAQLREMMPNKAVREIYAAIVADLAKRLPALRLALANGNTAEVHRIGHAIKGGCGMAGARQAARLGALLESGALDSSPVQFSALAPGRNHMDNSPPVLADLHAAALNLERMLEVEFPA